MDPVSGMVTIQGPNGVYHVPAEKVQGRKLPQGYSIVFGDRPPVNEMPSSPLMGGGAPAPAPAAAPAPAPAPSAPAAPPMEPKGMGDVQEVDATRRWKDDEGVMHYKAGGGEFQPRRDNADTIMPLPGSKMIGGLFEKLGGGLMEKAIARSGIGNRVGLDALREFGPSVMAHDNPTIPMLTQEVADKALTAGQALKDAWPMAKTYALHKAGLQWWMLWPTAHKALRGIGSPAQEYVAGKAMSAAGPTVGAGIGSIPMMLRRPEGEEE